MSAVSVPGTGSEEGRVEVRAAPRAWSPWALLNSALITTLAGGALYLVGFSYGLGAVETIGIPLEVIPWTWTSQVQNGFLAVFWAAKAYVAIALVSLGLAYGLGGLFRAYLRRRAASGKPVTPWETGFLSFAENVLDPSKVMARAPRWVFPLMFGGMLSAYAEAALASAAPGSVPEGEVAVYEALARVEVVVGLAFFAAVGLGRTPWRGSLYEIVRRGGPVMQVFVAVLGVFTVATYAYGIGAFEAAAALQPGAEIFPRVTLHMEDASSPFHQKPVLLVFQVAQGYYVMEPSTPEEAPGPLVMIPASDVAYVVYA